MLRTKRTELTWEQVASDNGITTIRAKVPGGWLVSIGGSIVGGEGGVLFYADPKHAWRPLLVTAE